MQSLISIINDGDTLLVSSREIALNFDKQHKNVLQGIDNLIEQIGGLKIQPTPLKYFVPMEYEDIQGKIQKEYYLTYEGFSLLVMGFTGEKALKWKLDYIDAFMRMAKKLKERAKVLSTPFVNLTTLDHMKAEDFFKIIPQHMTMEEGAHWYNTKVYEAFVKAYDREVQKEERRCLNERLNRALAEQGD